MVINTKGIAIREKKIISAVNSDSISAYPLCCARLLPIFIRSHIQSLIQFIESICHELVSFGFWPSAGCGKVLFLICRERLNPTYVMR